MPAAVARIALAWVTVAGLLAACGDNLVDDTQPDAMIASTICSDGFDNDGDGSTDYPADPGCDSAADPDESNAPIAMCMDGRDNDADGKIDYPEDPGCLVALQNSETDDCPDGPNCPMCSNGQDDDGDSATDYPDDDGCMAASGNDEYGTDPDACGPGLTVTRLDLPTATGTLMGTSHITSTCGGGGGEVPYELIITEPSVIVATTDFPETTVDTSLYIRSDCMDPSTELVCNDNLSGTTLSSQITVSVPAGRYYLIVDARTIGETGNYKLSYSLYAGEGSPCMSQAECGPGLQCRIPNGGTEQICTDPVCSDAFDDDGDGFNDFPDDPGCATPGDFDEVDDCPSGPNCPACANGIDDDGDGGIDFGPGGDPDCQYAGQPAEGCNNESDPIEVMTTATVSGSTVGLTDDFLPNCAFGFSGPDAVHLVSLPAMSNFHITDVGTSYTGLLALHDQTCTDELACNLSFSFGGDVINSGPLAAGAYAVVMDGYNGATGSYNIQISGTIAPHGDCTGPLATAGVIACGAGYSCVGGECLGTLECNNGTDDDGDGKIDYPEDPGCFDANDTTEVDDCPSGPNCPACSNGVDDDGDGDIDYPADAECNAASQDAESCPTEHDPFLTLTMPTETGDLTGATNDFPLVCGGAGGADRVYLVTLPDIESITFDACGSFFDTVLALYNLDCSTSLACDDDSPTCGLQSVLPVTGLAAGTYALVVAAYSTGTGGPYTLHTAGTIAPNGRCDGPLATAGALTCGSGSTCNGMICVPAACNNSIDEDGDGFVGYPDDPGCASVSDNDESDNCPSGPGCATCSNNIDDDGNGITDYPDDPSCVAAGGTEGTCGFDSDGVSEVVIPLYSGSTAGLTDDFSPVCAFGSPAPDRAFSITLPEAVTKLHVDTAGSTYETVLSVTDATCTSVMACNFEGAGFGNSVVDLFGLPAGSYGIIVDGFSGGGNFLLGIQATVASGAACTDPLFSTGVLVCPANHICTAGTCQPL